MDISSVRIRPVQALAQAVMTSTHGHPRPNWPKVAQFNTNMVEYTLLLHSNDDLEQVGFHLHNV